MGIPENHPAVRQAVRRGLLPPAGKPKRKLRTVALQVPTRWAVVLYPPCRVVTEANTHEHWRHRARRVKDQALAVRAAWMFSPAYQLAGSDYPALAVTLTHFGPAMDDDNLRGAFKAVRDQIAALLGVDDADPRVTWRYDQRPGQPGVEIRIEGGEA